MIQKLKTQSGQKSKKKKIYYFFFRNQLTLFCRKNKLVLEMRFLKTHFLTTRRPTKKFLLRIVVFGGDNPRITEEFS
jgi:hypothetical protein